MQNIYSFIYTDIYLFTHLVKYSVTEKRINKSHQKEMKSQLMDKTLYILYVIYLELYDTLCYSLILLCH